VILSYCPVLKVKITSHKIPPLLCIYRRKAERYQLSRKCTICGGKLLEVLGDVRNEKEVQPGKERMVLQAVYQG